MVHFSVPWKAWDVIFCHVDHNLHVTMPDTLMFCWFCVQIQRLCQKRRGRICFWSWTRQRALWAGPFRSSPPIPSPPACYRGTHRVNKNKMSKNMLIQWGEKTFPSSSAVTWQHHRPTPLHCGLFYKTTHILPRVQKILNKPYMPSVLSFEWFATVDCV